MKTYRIIITAILCLMFLHASAAKGALESAYNSIKEVPGTTNITIRSFFTRVASLNKVKAVKVLVLDTPETAMESMETLVGRFADDPNISLVIDNEDHEKTLVLMNPVGKNIEMLVITYDIYENDAVCVFLKTSMSAVDSVLKKAI